MKFVLPIIFTLPTIFVCASAFFSVVTGLPTIPDSLPIDFASIIIFLPLLGFATSIAMLFIRPNNKAWKVAAVINGIPIAIIQRVDETLHIECAWSLREATRDTIIIKIADGDERSGHMGERYLIFIVGIVLVALSKYLAKGFLWWEREILKFQPQENFWVYRILWIAVGLIFIVVSVFEKSNALI